jgi:hypothetical protein
MSARHDPLGVLTSTEPVVSSARHVAIDHDRVRTVARQIAGGQLASGEWDSDLHWRGNPDATANYVLVLDALNFCFWGEPRWRVTLAGNTLDGYWALAAALKRALDGGTPLTDAEYLARIPAVDVATMLSGEHVIPLFSARVRNLREAGSVLDERWDGRFLRLVDAASGNAVRLVQLVVEHFPSFRDVARYDGREVRFYKRAQILAGDLAGSFDHSGAGALDDIEHLTAFADYKVPQVLHQLGVLRYDEYLMSILRARREIDHGSPAEVEIRAATIWAVEHLRQRLSADDNPIPAYQIDWHLWNLGQSLPGDTLPYHRTRTIYY